MAIGDRVRKWQPEGGLDGPGRSPFRIPDGMFVAPFEQSEIGPALFGAALQYLVRGGW